MRQIGHSIGSLVLAALLTVPSPLRAASPLLEEAVGLAGVAMFLESGATGMVLGVVHGGDDMVVGFGETAKGSGREPDGKSLLRIGSISKALAGELLGALAAEGVLSLTEPLQKHAPDGARVPDRDGRPITLLDLATHAAALPRELPLPSPSGAAPFAWPTTADRYAWLAQYRLPWAPGSAAAYSNVGFDLLGAALAKAAGKPYADLLRERITGAEAAPCVDTATIAGSGGIYSTADDMVLWLRHNLARADPAVWPVLALTHAAYLRRQNLTAAIGFDEAGPMDAIALAWLIEAADGHRPMILQKSGGLAGFMSYIAFAPGRDVGAFVSVNRIDFAMFTDLTEGVNELIAMLAPR
jgi:D-alanyl-D-alanine-carboxypeptidase/D-alanyl-D-alanine-endopeptidase